MEHIHIKGAREHNLKNLDLVLPRNQFIVITGLSGSGKSSLAFDTLYAEGQRRYVESLSAYARQFLDQMEKPDVDSIEGLSPAISIEQKTTSRNPRSTVATVTEIYDYLRLLYARTGKPHCMACQKPIASQTIQEMADHILALPEGTKLQILAPVVRGRKGEYKKLLLDLMKRGYILLEAVVGGALMSTVLIGLFGHVGDAQAESTRQARLITAEQLALREVEELRSLPYSGLASSTRTVAMTSNGSFRVVRTVANEASEIVKTSNNVTVRYRTVTVEVSFPDRTGVRDITTQTRIYRE